MKDIDSNQPPNFSEDMDIYYQEIEKATFLAESELKDFKELIYLCSSINKKYTALLYCDKEHSYLYLFILRHAIDKAKENISYKIKAKLVFNKNDIDKTNLDEKQMFMDEQGNKNSKNDYNIQLINRDLVLLQVIGKKLILINFDKKEYAVLFTNINEKKVIHVVDIFDELLLIKKEQNTDKNLKKYFQIRTYVFCIASGVLYFFIINDKVFSDLQFLLIPFPFEDEVKDCIDFKILKIMNKSREANDPTNQKYYFVLNILLSGKFVRYVTDFVNVSLKEILLKFKENKKNNLIRKSVDKFDKMNNFNNSKLKVYRSEKCASYIILQIDFHIFTFKYYENDSPEEMMKRIGIFDNKKNNIIEISNSKLDIINSSESVFKITNSNNKETSEPNSLLITNGKTMTPNFNSLNESSSPNRVQNRHQSLGYINIFQLKSSSKINYQMSSESINSNFQNSIDQPESNFTLTDTKEVSKEFNFNLSNKNNIHIKQHSFEKNLLIPEIKIKDKSVVYYSLQNLYNLDLNFDKDKEKEKDKEKDKEKTKDKIDNKTKNKLDLYNNAEELLKDIKYSFTFHTFISFIKKENSVIVCYTPDKSRDSGDIDMVTKYNRKLSLSNENIQILDILHYDSLKYSFLLTNNFIYKFRVNTDLLHILNISKHKNISDDPKKDMIYYKLKSIFKFSRSHKMPFSEKCKLCKKPESKIICPKCKRAVYCSLEHMQDDYSNIHFFQCEMNLCISKLNSDRKKNDSLSDFNNLIISFKNILNQIFILIENKKDYINYTMYLKIMLNILEYTNIEGFMNQVLSPMRSMIHSDYKQICDKIFILELWFFYLNLNILYIDFIIKSEMYYLATKLVNKVKILDIIENKDIKLPTMFAYFSLANDLIKYKMNENKEKIEQYSKNYFFDLLEIYTNNNPEGNYLYIHEQFFKYYLYSFCSLLKINLFLKEKIRNLKDINPINLDKIVYHIPILFEEKLNSVETNNINEFHLRLPLILLYYYLSFILVKIDKIPTAINILRYILEEIKKINEFKDNKNDKNSLENRINFDYFLLEAKIYLNIGILITYNGDFNLGIHYLENCFRLCFEKKLSTLLSIKVLKLLSLAYINHDKIDTAFILLKRAIKLTTKFLSVKKDFNSNILINKLLLFKLKVYLLFLYQYIAYKYQKMNKFLTNKIKGKNNIINDPDDIPASIFPINFNKMSPALIGYICEEDKNKKLAEFFKDQINKDDETFKFELDSNLDKFVFFCNNYKFEMIIKALEFLYKLSDKEYEILNNDNGSIQKEEIKEDNNYNQKERSSSISRDSSMSYSKVTFNKDKLGLYFKEDKQNFFDEIEVKMGLYDQLSDLQQKELKSIQNNIFRRSILLRDPKGKIDKFNLNYHPKYTFDFYELFTKMSETIFLNQLEKYGAGENYESKIFEHKNGELIYSLRKYINLEKIQNILYLEKVKLIDQYKQNIIFLQKYENRETVTKNKIGMNEYMNKLKEKLGKDKFLKNMNMEGLYEKLLKELTYRELDHILESPSKILNYIYINSKPLTDDQNLNYNIQKLHNENKNNDNDTEEINSNNLRNSNIGQKNNKIQNEVKKKNLSPKEIYNNLIDLLSEKRKERSQKKKQTVNFKNMKIANFLNTSKSEIKINNLNKKNDNDKKKKPSLLRSITLNKIGIGNLKNKVKKTAGNFTQSYNKNKSFDRKLNFRTNYKNKKNFKINEFMSSKNKKYSKNNSNKNTDDKLVNDFNDNNTSQYKVSNFAEMLEKTQENPEIMISKKETNKEYISKKSNIIKKRYQRDKTQKDTFVYEENITQQKKQDIKKEQPKKNNIYSMSKIRRWTKIYDNKNTHESNSSLINVPYDNYKNGDNTDYLRETIEKTFNKYKNKSRSTEKYSNYENENKKEVDDDESNKKEKKVQYVQRKKPTFKEFREKVLHKNSKISYSTFY